jgi:hypothetical protein
VSKTDSNSSRVSMATSSKRSRRVSTDSEDSEDLSWLLSATESSQSDEGIARTVYYPTKLHAFAGDSSTSTDDSQDGSDASQETSQDTGRPNEHSEPLFAGSRVSALEAYILIFQYALRHHLTAKAFSELLLLLQVLLPAVNLLPKSLYLLKNFFMKAFPNICVNEQSLLSILSHTP